MAAMRRLTELALAMHLRQAGDELVDEHAHVGAVEIQRWERIPLALPLVIGQERIVFVDQNVRVGVPRNLEGKLRVQSTGGALYLLANEPIEPTRLQLQNMTSGEIMLVDIAATPGQANQPAPEPVKIVAGDNPAARYGQQTSAPKQAATRPTTATAQDGDQELEEQPAETELLPVLSTCQLIVKIGEMIR